LITLKTLNQWGIIDSWVMLASVKRYEPHQQKYAMTTDTKVLATSTRTLTARRSVGKTLIAKIVPPVMMERFASADSIPVGRTK